MTWLTETMGKYLIGALVIAAMLVGMYVMHEHVIVANEQVVAIGKDKADAEHDRDTAIAAAASNALVTAAVARDASKQMEQLTGERDVAVARAATVASILTEIQNAPHTSVCSSSPAVGIALDGLRNARAARAALNDSGEAGSPASGPVAAGVHSGQ